MSSTKRSIRTLIFLAIVIALLVGVMAIAKAWTPKLGLDLTGGTTITLTASDANGKVDPNSLQLARTILQQRVDAIGVGESDVTTSGERQIIVAVPNVQRDELVKMVGQTAQLYFRQVYAEAPVAQPVPVNPSASPSAKPSTEPSAKPSTAPSAKPSPVASVATEASVAPKASAQPAPATTPSTAPANKGKETLSVEQAIAYKPSPAELKAFQDYKCKEEDQKQPATLPLITCDREGQVKYLLGPAILRGEDLTNAQAGIQQNSVSWQVNLTLNSKGADEFYRATDHLSKQQSPQNQFAIVLDDRVVSSPYVRQAIPGGNAEITGHFTQKSATDLANVLKYGALPLSFDLSSVDTVSASLGADQLRSGLIAGAIGLALVVLYCILYYHGLALVTVASLGIAAIFTYALMVLLGQSVGFALNLPGIAGAIVAIGITADSFVVYFERIRDEVREGRTLRTAIESGWVRSRWTILAADSVSLLSAIVLFILAIGAVKGFAFTLGLTTLIDIAVVFWFTKPMMTLLGHTKFFGQGKKFSGFEADHMGAKTIRTTKARKEA